MRRRFDAEAVSAAQRKAEREFRRDATLSTVAQATHIYLTSHQTYYGKSQQQLMRYALDRLDAVAGDVHPLSLSLSDLYAARELMVNTGCSRNTCNQYFRLIRQFIYWAEPRGLVAEGLSESVAKLPAWRYGRVEAHETEGGSPVDPVLLKRTFRGLKRIYQSEPTTPRGKACFHLWSMLAVNLKTGMRPDELCRMTWGEIDTSDPTCWVYQPKDHKTAHCGLDRKILIGRRAQNILLRWAIEDPCTPIFRIKRSAYWWKLQKWLKRLGLERWKPAQLRHNYTTLKTRIHGKEVTQVLLSHADGRTTDHYIQPDLEGAKALVRRIG